MMKLIKYPSKEQWAELLKRPALNTESLFDTVRTIINKVRAEGDKAVLEYEAAFDKVTLSALTVTSEEIQKAEGLISDELKSAITLAKRNIETFHSSQRFVGKKVETMEGVTCWQKAVGIEKVGLYIPGGTAPLFSTVLMLAVPAKIAGCREIVLCTPPDKNGNIHLLTVRICKLKRFLPLLIDQLLQRRRNIRLPADRKLQILSPFLLRIPGLTSSKCRDPAQNDHQDSQHRKHLSRAFWQPSEHKIRSPSWILLQSYSGDPEIMMLSHRYNPRALPARENNLISAFQRRDDRFFSLSRCPAET